MSEIWRCLGESRPEVWGCPGNVCLGRVWRIPKAGRGLQGWVECGMHSRGAGVGRRAVGNGDEAQRRKLEELECGVLGWE